MKLAHLKYIVSLLIFGSNGVVVSFVTLGSTETVFFRAAIGGIFLIVAFALSRQKLALPHAGRQAVWIIVSGVAMGASWVFMLEAYKSIGVSVATLAYYCGPVIVMVLAPVVFREKVSAAKVVGFAAVVAGMLCVNLVGVLEGGLNGGLVFGLLSAIMYAVMVIFNKKATKVTGLENAMWQIIVTAVVVGAFSLASHGGAGEVSADDIFPLAVLGLMNGGLGVYLYFSSIHGLSAQSVSILGYLEPLSALVFSAAFLGERLSFLQLIGAVLILGGAAFGELYKGRGGRAQEELPTEGG